MAVLLFFAFSKAVCERPSPTLSEILFLAFYNGQRQPSISTENLLGSHIMREGYISYLKKRWAISRNLSFNGQLVDQA